MNTAHRLSDGPPRVRRRRARDMVPASVRRGVAQWRLRGEDVECTCCGRSFRSFAPDKRGWPVACPGCGSDARHRLLAHYLRTELGPLAGRRILHFAPEPWVAPLLDVAGADYVSADIDDPRAELNFDIQDIPLPPDTVDVIVCSHVLEHVPDDRRATRELVRILRPGGVALVLVPQDPSRSETYEDPSITSPEDRLAHFWQADHLRLYGTDVGSRLEEDGFTVLVDRYMDVVNPQLVARHVMWSPGMCVATK